MITEYTGVIPDKNTQNESDFDNAVQSWVNWLTKVAPEINTDTAIALANKLATEAARDAALATANIDVYSPTQYYNFPDAVIAFSGKAYRCIGTNVYNDDPDTSSSGDWAPIGLDTSKGPENLLINPCFDDELNTSGYNANGAVALLDGVYGHDMWKTESLTNGHVKYKKESNGDITITEIYSPGAGSVGLYQKNNNLNTLAQNKIVTASINVISLDEPLKLALGNGLLKEITETGWFLETRTIDSGYFHLLNYFTALGTLTPNFRFNSLKVEFGTARSGFAIPDFVLEQQKINYYHRYYVNDGSASEKTNVYIAMPTTTNTRKDVWIPTPGGMAAIQEVNFNNCELMTLDGATTEAISFYTRRKQNKEGISVTIDHTTSITAPVLVYVKPTTGYIELDARA